MNELALFAGAGGGILGGKLLGWKTVCAVEWEPYPAAILAARQNEGFLPPFPIWDDVQTFDGRPWRGLVDVVSGGFPCQDISAAGKGAGITGERSGMWSHMARIIGEVRPRYAFVENSPVLTSRGLGVVLGDLAAMGYDAEWGVLGAVHAGAPHERERIWIVAHTNGARLEEHGELLTALPERSSEAKTDQEPEKAGGLPYSTRRPLEDGEDERCGMGQAHSRREATGSIYGDMSRHEWWGAEPDVGRVADGVAARVDRLKAIGNGQVPAVVRLAWNTIYKRLKNQ